MMQSTPPQSHFEIPAALKLSNEIYLLSERFALIHFYQFICRRETFDKKVVLTDVNHDVDSREMKQHWHRSTKQTPRP
jgi:hypothetical protein